MSNIDILIGQDYTECLQPLSIFGGKLGQPWAMQTLLGLAVCGNDKTRPSNEIGKNVASTFITSISNGPLRTPVRINQVPTIDRTMSIEDNLEKLMVDRA